MAAMQIERGELSVTTRPASIKFPGFKYSMKCSGDAKLSDLPASANQAAFDRNKTWSIHDGSFPVKCYFRRNYSFDKLPRVQKYVEQ